MLAYVFWHRPRPEAGVAAYEAGLAALHASLAAEPPPGFRGSASFDRAALPFFDGYEDWYLVDDWTALGVLNDAAPGHAAHDAVAGRSLDGAGAVYALTGGAPELAAVRSAAYADEPVGGDATWRRQLVLGPAPQYLAHSAGPGGGTGAGVIRRPVRVIGPR